MFIGNKINVIHNGVWNGVNTTLSVIKFWGNVLPMLQENAFMHLVALKELEFSNNQISQVNPGTFNGLISVKKFSLNDTRMESASMVGLENVLELKWESSGLTVMTKEILKHFPDLRKLMLPNNKISSIEQDAWNNTRNIDLIDLTNYELVVVKAEMFSHLPHLLSLNLNDNKIAEIETNAWAGLNHMMLDLALSGNQLFALYLDMFKGLTGLSHLNLDNNRIFHLPAWSSKWITRISGSEPGFK